MPTTLRTETDGGVRSVVLSRAAEYNTITPALRDDPFGDYGSGPRSRQRQRDGDS